MRPRRFLYLVGALLVSSGLFHLGVFLVDGGPWAGPLSWRKPVTFGISFGLTALAVAWISAFLELGARGRWSLLGGLGVASGLEVGWVTLQAWRGVPSHFASAGIDEALFIAAGISIAVVGVILVAVTVSAFRRPILPASMAVAIRVGLVLLLIGQGLGGAIIANGTAVDRPPTEADLAVFGTAGAMKVPHAVALHAVQVLPLLALILGYTTLTERRRTQMVIAGALGYGLLVAASMAQTFSGRGPLEPSVTGSLFALTGVAILVAAFAAAIGLLLAGVRGSRVPATSAPADVEIATSATTSG